MNTNHAHVQKSQSAPRDSRERAEAASKMDDRAARTQKENEREEDLYDNVACTD